MKALRYHVPCDETDQILEAEVRGVDMECLQRCGQLGLELLEALDDLVRPGEESGRGRLRDQEGSDVTDQLVGAALMGADVLPGDVGEVSLSAV